MPSTLIFAPIWPRMVADVTALFCTVSTSNVRTPPESRCNRISLVPSPLKSPVPSTCQLLPTTPSVGADCTALLLIERSRSVMDPMLQDVAGTVMVEVADAVHLPVSTDYPQCWGRLHRVVVYYEHFKGPGAACVPMQQDVTGATVVEVADAVHDPVQTGRADI